MAQLAPTPPHSREAEQAVLGSLLLDEAALPLVQGILSSADFYSPAHALIYGAMIAVAERGPADFLAICDHLKRHGQLEEAGGHGYITRLVTDTPTAMHAEHYARMVKRDAGLRALIALATYTAQEAYAAGDETTLEEVLGNIGHRLQEIAGDGGLDGAVLLGSESVAFLEGLIARWETDHREGRHNPSWPSHALRQLSPGLDRGELAVMAAESSVGKTVWAEMCAEYWARFEGRQVIYFHGELNHARMMLRRLSRHSGVPMVDLQRGFYPEAARVAHQQIAAWAARIHYVNTAGHPIEWIIGKAESLLAKGMGEIFILDYLGVVPESHGMAHANQETVAARKMAAFKDFISRRDTFGLVLSQVNRTEEGQRIKGARSLRDSGQIFEKANIVLYAHRKLFTEDGDDQGVRVSAGNHSPITTMQVAKQTNGATGAVTLLFRPETLEFVDCTLTTEKLE